MQITVKYLNQQMVEDDALFPSIKKKKKKIEYIKSFFLREENHREKSRKMQATIQQKKTRQTYYIQTPKNFIIKLYNHQNLVRQVF